VAVILGKLKSVFQFIPLSSDSSILTSRVGFVPVTTVTGILTDNPSQAVGSIAEVVVVVIIAPLATSVTTVGRARLAHHTVAVTVPLTGCVALTCDAGIGSVAYVHCTNLQD